MTQLILDVIGYLIILVAPALMRMATQRPNLNDSIICMIKIMKQYMLQICVLFLFAITATGQVFNVQVIPSSTSVSSTAEHQIHINYQNPSVQASSIIQIQYESNWDLTSITYGDTTDFCQTGCTIGSISPTVTGQKIALSGFFPSAVDSTFNIQYTIKNLVNPSSEVLTDVKVFLNDPGNIPLELNIGTISITKAPITCSLTPSVLAVQTLSDYQIQINPTMTLPSTVYAIFYFPTKWQNSQTSGTFISGSVACSSTSSPSISCSQVNTKTLRGDTIIPSSSASSFNLTITNINNPGSIQDNNELQIVLFNNSQAIANCFPTISGLSPRTFSSFNFDVSGSVGSLVTPQITFQIDETPSSTDWLQIYFPTEYQLSTFTASFVYIGNETLAVPGEVIVQNTSSNNIAIIFPFQSDSLATYTIQLHQIILPTSEKQVDNITVHMLRHGYLVATATCCSFTPSHIQSTSIVLSLSSSIIGETSSYQVTATLSVPAYSFLIVTFDSEYSLSAGTYVCSTDAQVDNPICTRQSSTTILVSNFPTSLTEINLNILGIQNPSTIEDMNLTVSTVDASQNLIQVLTETYNLVSTSITSVNVTVDDPTTMATTSYEFRIENRNELKINPEVKIVFPPSTIVQNSSKCFVNTVEVACSVVGNEVQIPVGSSAISPTQLKNINITINNIINPASFKATSSFQISLLSNSSVLQELKTQITISMNIVPDFTSLTITLSNQTTYTSASYTFDIELPEVIDSVYPAIYSQMRIEINFPSDYFVEECTGCSEYFSFDVNLNQNIFSLVVDSVRNPYTITTSSTFTFFVYLDNYLSLQHSDSSLTSWQPHEIEYSLSHNSTYLKESTIVEISINETIPEQVHSIKITIPSDYGLVDVSVSTNYQSVTDTINIRQITLSNMGSINGIIVVITGLTNPSLNTTNSWTVQFYNENNVLMGRSTSLVYFTTQCSMPCRSCETAPSVCDTCYTDITITSLNYLSGSSCVSGCSSSQYQINNLCYDCSNDCSTCSLADYNCSSCNNGTYLFENQCLTQCPSNYYEDSSSNQCLRCTSPCWLCTNLTCTYCQSGYVLTIENNCVGNCPTGFYNKSNICEQCADNCSQCTSDGCTNCINNTYLYNGSCQVNCPLTLYISGDGLTCESCKLPCLTCDTYSSQCSSCDRGSANKYFHSSSCLTGCPSGTYANQFDICEDCVSPCNQCESAIDCINCEAGFNYFADLKKCFLSCPNNTILVVDQCFQCEEPCLQCSNSPTNCLSCIQTYFLTGSTCSLTCTLPNFALDRQCKLCASPCVTCANLQPYQCTSCESGYYIMGTSCYTQCPEGTFINGLNCQLCTSGCLTCSGSSSTCESCYPGLYLYGTNCISTCPTSPIYYYQYQSQCIACQPQCQSCLSTPVECESCASSSDFLNLITRQCSPTCSDPYYQSISGGVNVCVQCEIPCKQCSTSSTTCSSCYNGRYLHSQSCLENCPATYYSDMANNICAQCPTNCLSCENSEQCTQCAANIYYYQAKCYVTCPSEAPYIYKSYCRNCLKDNCILCNDDNQCILCQENYYNYESSCYSSCPSGYEPDSVTQTRCIQTEEAALLIYLTEQEKYKAYLLPGSIVFFFLLPLLFFLAESKIAVLYALIGLPQTATYIFLTVMTVLFPTMTNSVIPSFVVYALGGIFILLNILHFCLIQKMVRKDKLFSEWISYGKNEQRFSTIAVFSLLNKKFVYIIFSGFLKLPFTCAQVSSDCLKTIRRLNILHIISFFVVQIPYIGYVLYIIVVEKLHLTNYKLMFAAVDVTFITFLSIIITIVFAAKQLKVPPPYFKYILEGISNYSLPALSESLPQFQQEDLELHRSNSVQLLKESEGMKAVDFKSVFDPEDYEDPPQLDTHEIPHALKKGTFRKSNMKKKKKNGRKLNDLQVISEEDSSEEEKDKKKKKKRRMRKVKHGYMNNYIYWKPPEKKQKSPLKDFKIQQKQIMKKIKEKQSEFDTITQNDIIFQEQSMKEQSRSSDSSDFYEEQSKRQLNPKFDVFFNRNYANKKHLS